MADRIDDAYADHDLPPRWKVALGVADRVAMVPRPPTPAEAAELAAHFDDEALTELVLGAGLFHGFSKMLIGLGFEPEGMETTVLPTPEAADSADPPLHGDDPHVRLLAAHPLLAGWWQRLADELWVDTAAPAELLEVARTRLATLHGVAWAADPAPEHPLAAATATLTECFAFDVRAIDDAVRRPILDAIGMAGLTHLFLALAVYDGIYRVASCTDRAAAPA